MISDSTGCSAVGPQAGGEWHSLLPTDPGAVDPPPANSLDPQHFPCSSSKLTLHISLLCHLPLNTCLQLRFCISSPSPTEHQEQGSGSAPERCPALWSTHGLEGKATWSRRVLYPIRTEKKQTKNLHLHHQWENFSAQC